MKTLFLLDITSDKQEITVPNGRTLEVLPQQLQLKQAGPGETWLGGVLVQRAPIRAASCVLFLFFLEVDYLRLILPPQKGND